eukprot:CAMPEP_0174724526 /NCGR_PEP_ID=MMETSP1094-20130205/43492_1 /TAXON_ID=156173 /ORGANISM="Chrysochromulina brevifilum, Strain UTEX LB 985" /LENGTH=287 /DNA_ID=CAMNT_0015925755 /DNA_START=24 /DNA_END=887 /DNA_ORIENTATION=+
MLRATLLAVFLLGSEAFVCPPKTEADAVKAENEVCGGPCDSSGICAEGLKCVKPKTSTFSFAVLAFPAVGKCTRPVVEETKPEARKLGFIAGGNRDIDLNDQGVVAAAKFAETHIQSMSNSLTKPALSKVVSAQKQVVAGIKYTLGLRMSDGHVHRISIVDTPWRTERYKVDLFEPNALDSVFKPEARQLAGGKMEVDVNDEGVLLAAKFALSYLNFLLRPPPEPRAHVIIPEIAKIVSAHKQVVEGTKYTLGLKMTDGHVHRITVVDTPWLKPRFKVDLYEPNALD